MINKPINPYPYNCCVDINNDLNIKYEIPNNEKIDGRYISINSLETGECVLESYENVSEPTSKVEWCVGDSLSQYGDSEYSWSSFYWQTPTKEPDKTWTVSNINTQTGDISLKAHGDISRILTLEATKNTKWDSYKACSYMIGHNEKTYSSILFHQAHEDDDDTSSMCFAGVLQDYYGYPCIEVQDDILSCVKEMGIGKCVIDIYDEENILVARTRCLAYQTVNTNYTETLFPCYLIIDNKNFGDNLRNKFEEVKLIETEYTNSITYYKQKILLYHHVNLYNIEDLNNQEDLSGMLNHEDLYCNIRDYSYSTHEYVISTQPVITDKIQIGDTFNMWARNSNGANFNTSPAYYFRYKPAPQITVNHFSQLQTEDDINILKDVKCRFGISYSSSKCKLNYFYLYLYAFNSQTNNWELQERTPMLHTLDATYDFIGLYHGQKYKVFAVCTDKDGDEWSSEELQFTINNPAIPAYFIPAYDIQVVFNRVSTTIDVSLEKYLTYYKNVTIEFYKITRNDVDNSLKKKLEYAGGGVPKIEGAIVFTRWSDYNICNDTYYDYFLRVDYQKYDGTSGLEWLWVANNVHTEFCGTSILGLEKVNGTQLEIVNSFNILYQLDKNMGELNNELSREYMNSFSKYPKELKGHQNYISSSFSGLLGDERKGIYVEPRGIRKAWNKFVDDDTIKLYRGFDGETMIISIDTNRVKPFYYPNVGIVNEVSITFKEIASAGRYAIFSTTGG